MEKNSKQTMEKLWIKIKKSEQEELIMLRFIKGLLGWGLIIGLMIFAAIKFFDRGYDGQEG